MTVLKPLATLTLHAIHFCIWVKTLLSVFTKWITTKVTEVLKHKGVKVDLIQKDAKQLKKIPFHLALIVAEDQLHYTDLARIVCWAFLAGIQYISIFDQKGQYEAMSGKLQNVSPFGIIPFCQLNSETCPKHMFYSFKS